MLRLASFLLLTGCALQAQITGPSTLVFDEATRSLRFVLGVPGASHFGPALAEGLTAMAVSPDGSRALGSHDGQVASYQMVDGTLAERLLMAGEASSVAWDAGSRYAAFLAGSKLFRYDAGSGDLLELGDAAGRLAVDRAGVVFAASAGAVTRYTGSEALRLAGVGSPVDLALSADGAALYVADTASRSVLRIDARQGGAQSFSAVAADPVALALSKDGASLLVADGEGHKVYVLSVDTQELRLTLDLAFAPSRLTPLSDSLFALTRREAGAPLEVLALRDSAAAYFIPAVEGN
ncbi:MAG: hypothetical protein JNK87_31430 [Bryobacterales bacterium]|nr:hypothetical protein [Bryobacterales bacterium]